MRKKTLSNTTLACVEPADRAIRVLEKQALHPQWRENDAWETADQGRETIRQEFPDVRFVSHSDFQSAYGEQRRQGAKTLSRCSDDRRVSLSWDTSPQTKRRSHGEKSPR